MNPYFKGDLMFKLRTNILGLTQIEFAELIGVKRGMIIRYEKGKTPLPLDNKEFNKLCKKHKIEIGKNQNNGDGEQALYSKKEKSNREIIKMLDWFSDDERKSVVEYITEIGHRKVNSFAETAKDLDDG